jgi:hypothetical protein
MTLAAAAGNSRMDQLGTDGQIFALPLLLRRAWAGFGADTPLTLTADEVRRLRSLYDPIDLDEVRRIYLSLSRLLSAHVETSAAAVPPAQALLQLGEEGHKTPFIIGMAGSVAVGKSTTARILKELLARWPSSPKVDLVTTDGFLYPNEVLRRENLMERKGFPDSYDVGALLRFLSAIKSGQPNVRAPVYSHLTYDVMPGDVRHRRSARHPDLRGHQRAAAARTAQGRQVRADRLGFLRFLDLYRRRRGNHPRTGMSNASCACARRLSATRSPSSIVIRS